MLPWLISLNFATILWRFSSFPRSGKTATRWLGESCGCGHSQFLYLAFEMWPKFEWVPIKFGWLPQPKLLVALSITSSSTCDKMRLEWHVRKKYLREERHQLPYTVDWELVYIPWLNFALFLFLISNWPLRSGLLGCSSFLKFPFIIFSLLLPAV